MLGGFGDRRELTRYLSLSQVGLEMVVPVGIGVVVDHYLQSSPWGVIVGAVLGLTGGLFHMVQLLNQDEDPPPPPRNPESPA
jgi:F0F1-type ATP synthase assembly protein I